MGPAEAEATFFEESEIMKAEQGKSPVNTSFHNLKDAETANIKEEDISTLCGIFIPALFLYSFLRYARVF
jgi:hypothetical protein